MDNLSLAIQLSNKLGWGDMLAHIALPAIEEILYISNKSVDELLLLDADSIFGFLAGIDVTYEDWSSLISVRDEIEEAMRQGISHTEAINEWWK